MQLLPSLTDPAPTPHSSRLPCNYTLGFLSCCVLEGLAEYAASFLHSYVQCPNCRHLWHLRSMQGMHAGTPSRSKLPWNSWEKAQRASNLIPWALARGHEEIALLPFQGGPRQLANLSHPACACPPGVLSLLLAIAPSKSTLRLQLPLG